MRRLSLALTALAIVAAAGTLHGRQSPARPGAPVRDAAPDGRPARAGTGAVSGTVTVIGTGQPARRARMTLSGESGPPRHTVTDSFGRFAFAQLPAGRYSLSASKPGHVPSQFGQVRPGGPGTQIQLADGQHFQASLQMARGGVLTGTVLDEDGEAVPGTQVRALRFVMQKGERTLQPAGNASTDDRGIYRIFGLQPGEYVVAATPRNLPDRLRERIDAIRDRIGAAAPPGEGRDAIAAKLLALDPQAIEALDAPATGYAAVYYPGTTALAQAAVTPVGPGEERSGLDFQLQRVSVARVAGFIVNSTGQPVRNIQVQLTDLGSVGGIGTNSARADAQGRFQFSSVAPGQYRITARAVAGETGRGGGRGGRGGTPADGLRLWATTDITVDGRDLDAVALALQPGVAVAGRAVFQGTSLPPPTDLSRVRITLVPADTAARSFGAGAPAAQRLEASGRFTIPSVIPGRYRINAGGAPEGWILESANVDGQNAVDFPFEIKGGQNVGSVVVTFTDQRSELTGALMDGRGQPAPGYTLIVFPADPRYWQPDSRRIRVTRPATDGQYRFGNLPAGDYRIAPVVDVEPGAWFDPSYLQQLEAAALHVSIAEGEKKIQNVRIAGGG